MPQPPGPWPAARWLLINDLNNDGHPDAVMIADREAVILLGQTAIRQRIDLSPIAVSRAALLDYDNDGWLDFCAAGTKRDAPDQGVVRLWRNPGGDSEVTDWSDVSQATGLASTAVPPMANILAADADLDGDTDLLLVLIGGGLRPLRNDGGNVNGQLKVRFVSSKTNPTGLGTHVEVRGKDFWATRGVSELPVEIGVGKREKLDAVQTLWTNGVIDNTLEVAVGRKPITILEKNVATGSCPFLYAWDGRGYRFVTDILGNSPIGLSLQRDVMLAADPDE